MQNLRLIDLVLNSYLKYPKYQVNTDIFSIGGSEIQLKNGEDKVGSNSASIVIRSGTGGSPPSPSTGSNGVTYYWSSFIFNTAGQPILTQRDLNLAFLLGCIAVSIALMMVVGIIKVTNTFYDVQYSAYIYW